MWICPWNVIGSSLGHVPSIHRVQCKSVRYFLCNPAERQTKQTNQQTDTVKSITSWVEVKIQGTVRVLCVLCIRLCPSQETLCPPLFILLLKCFNFKIECIAAESLLQGLLITILCIAGYYLIYFEVMFLWPFWPYCDRTLWRSDS